MVCHVVAVPYPGRGHVNPMMNLCKILASSSMAPQDQDILITFVVTEEWQSLIGSDQNRPNNIRISTIPNVLPSESVRGSDFPGFYEAVMTKMEAPFETLLQKFEMQATLFLADTELQWIVPLANSRNIPVAFLWTCSASVFSMFLHSHLFRQNGHLGIDLSEHGEKRVEYIPRVSSTRIADLPTVFNKNDEKVLQLTVQCISRVKQVQYLLLNSIYELEPRVIDFLKDEYSFPVYSVGPAIPFVDIINNRPTNGYKPDYLQWLDSQPKGSVLYISLGSFLSVSTEQMEEIVAGVGDSGVRFLWVARRDYPWIKQTCGARGFVVSWCDQLRVLCHSSIGGFLSHCGWNSVLEATFAGVPVLTFPIFFDQTPNSKQIVEDWKVGWRGKAAVGAKSVVTREEIAGLVGKFMNSESNEVEELRKRAKEVQKVCRRAIAEGGSSASDLNAFVQDVLQSKQVHERD